MRMMLRASLDTEAANKAIKDGSLGTTLKGLMEELKPEAAYFATSPCGQRQITLVFDMKDTVQIPSVCEPLFMTLKAEVQLTPVMNAQDLEKGLAAWAKKQ